MLRRSTPALGIHSWAQHKFARDPNEKLLRGQWNYLQSMKRVHGVVLGTGFVISTIVFDQLISPHHVKLPKQDGRSLVT